MNRALATVSAPSRHIAKRLHSSIPISMRTRVTEEPNRQALADVLSVLEILPRFVVLSENAGNDFA